MVTRCTLTTAAAVVVHQVHLTPESAAPSGSHLSSWGPLAGTYGWRAYRGPPPEGMIPSGAQETDPKTIPQGLAEGFIMQQSPPLELQHNGLFMKDCPR